MKDVVQTLPLNDKFVIRHVTIPCNKSFVCDKNTCFMMPFVYQLNALDLNIKCSRLHFMIIQTKTFD